MPKITIILTSLNHSKFIEEAIESILDQTFNDFELVILDDCSSDGSLELIRNYKDSRIKLIISEGPGNVVLQINKAINNSSSTYIAISHSDDVWMPDKLEKQMLALENDPNLGAVFSNAQVILSDGTPLEDQGHFYYEKFKQRNRSRAEWLRSFFDNGNCLCHPSILIKKNCYLTCGVYSNLLAQLPDFEMWVRLCSRYEIYIIQEPLVKFRVLDNDENSSGNRVDTRNRNSIEYIYLLNSYLKVLDRHSIFNIFPDFQNYNLEEKTDVDYVFSRILLELKDSNPSRLFALNLLHEIVSCPERSLNLKNYYDFTFKDYIKLTGKYDIFNNELIKILTDIDEEDLTILLLSKDKELKLLRQLNDDLKIENKKLQKSHQLLIKLVISPIIFLKQITKKIIRILTRLFLLLKKNFNHNKTHKLNTLKILYKLFKSFLQEGLAGVKKTFYLEEHLLDISVLSSSSQLKLGGKEILKIHDKTLGLKSLAEKELMIFDHNGGGGTAVYTNDLIEKHLNEGYAITRVYNYYGFIIARRIFKDKEYFFDFKDFDEFFLLVPKINISKIIINSLYGFTNIPEVSSKIIEFSKSSNSQFEIKIHDYHILCPSPHLMNSNDKYCGVPKDEKKCMLCLQSNNSWYHDWIPVNDRPKKIDQWRKPFTDLLKNANEVTIFDKSAFQILSNGFDLDEAKVKLKPHSSNYCSSLRKPLLSLDNIHIGFIGLFCKPKGSGVIRDIIAYANNTTHLPITLIGKNFEELPSVMGYSGEYSVENLPDLIELSGVNVIFFASIIPETFSYTLSECIQMQLPILSFDIGAQSNRLQDYKFGKVIPLDSTPSYIVNSLMTLFELYKAQSLVCSSTPQ